MQDMIEQGYVKVFNKDDNSPTWVPKNTLADKLNSGEYYIKSPTTGMGDVQKQDTSNRQIEPIKQQVTNSKNFKKYKITNPDNNDTFTISMDHSPSDEEIDKISTLRQQTKEQGKKSLEQADDATAGITDLGKGGSGVEGIKSRLYNTLSRPSEMMAPKVMAPNQVEQLPIKDRLARLGQETASGITSPENLPLILAGATGPVGAAGAGIVGTGKMLMNLPSAIKSAYQHPSLETVGRAGLNVVGAAGGALGTYGLLKNNFTPPSPQLKIGTSPLTGPQTIPQQRQLNAVPSRVSGGEESPIDVTVKPPNQISAGQQGQITENASPSPKLIPSKGEQPIRGQGFTVNAPKVVRPNNGVTEIDGRTLKTNTSTPDYRTRFSTKAPTGFQIPKVQPPTESETVTPKVEQVNQIPPETKNVTPAPESSVKSEVSVKDVHAERELASTSRMIDNVNKSTKATTKPIEPQKIDNEWLRGISDNDLQILRPGSKGQLGDEIDTVLKERNLVKDNNITQKEGNPNFNEKAFNDYSALLNDLASHGKEAGHILLKDISHMGKQAGLDQETVANDLIENLHPEVTNPSNKAWNATNKVFNPEEED